MRIGFDGTTLRPGKTGVGFYTEHLLLHLLKEREDDRIIVFSNRAVEATTDLPCSLEIRCGSKYVPLTSLWMQFVAPRELRRARADIAHFTNSILPLRKVVPTVLTVHDMSLSVHPNFHPLKRRLLQPLVTASIKAADALITVSDNAKSDIVRLTGIPSNKVFVVYEAASPAFKPITDQDLLESIRNKYGLSERNLLSVGTLEPRKNLPVLIQAFADLKKNSGIPHKLVLVGSPGWGHREVQEQIERNEIAEDVVLTGYVPFEDLPPLYNLAEIFVFPSHHEGFGLPVVEAMACGCPVICSSGSSLREITLGESYPVDPDDGNSIAEAIATLINDPDRRKEMGRRSQRSAAGYSWSKAARETLRVYREVLRS